MDQFSDLRAAVQSDMTAGSDSALFNPATVDLSINRSYRKIGDVHLWPQLEDSQKTSSQANQEYYDYPQNWRPESAWKLRVGGIDYGEPTLFSDYQFEKDNNFPSRITRMWSNRNQRYFIYPTPTGNGNNDIEIWGFATIAKLIQDSDTTIFSFTMPSVLEAIVLEAIAILKAKGGEEPTFLRSYVKGSLLLSIESQQIVEEAWHKVVEQKQKATRSQPFFDVPDFFPVRRNVIRNKIGGF